ncbi:MAG: hypothetical protein GY715_01595, partial [Planctomycetes bacterium]|nr:hypothetical protein [Planctomycetota bacterium]
VEILAAETGVDVASLLLRHQSFATLEEGRGAYTEAFRTARAARDHLAAATALLRLVELDLADRVPVEKDLLAADYLAKAGLIEAGAAVFQHHIDRAAGLREAAPSPDAERRAMGAWAELLLLFARYAIRHDAYPVAYAAADELRAAGIEDSVVLTIRAHQLARAGRHGEAAETARRVLAGLGPDDRGTPARAMLVRLAEEGEEP